MAQAKGTASNGWEWGREETKAKGKATIGWLDRELLSGPASVSAKEKVMVA